MRWAWAAIVLLLSAPAHALTVEEAYQAIPHARTTFDPTGSAMDSQEKEFLRLFFSLVEEGTVNKMTTVLGKQDAASSSARYKAIQDQIQALQAPTKLKKVRSLVLDALKDHQRFLEQSPQPKSYSHTLVQSSSRKLHQAYSELMKLYPNESGRNRQAFFDYLCALDFT